MLKIEDMVEDLNNLDEAALAQLSDKLWELGNLDDINEILMSCGLGVRVRESDT